MAQRRQAPRPQLTSLRLDDLVPHIQQNLKLEEFRGFMRRPVKNCFQAKNLVSWLHTNEISSSRVHAVELGQQLLEERYIRSIPNAKETDFHDGDGWFQWEEPVDQVTTPNENGGRGKSPSVRSTLFASTGGCMSPSQPRIQRNVEVLRHSKGSRESRLRSVNVVRTQRAESEMIRLRLKSRDLEKRLDRRNKDYMQLRQEYFAFKEAVRQGSIHAESPRAGTELPQRRQARGKPRSQSTDSATSSRRRASRSPPRRMSGNSNDNISSSVDPTRLRTELDSLTRDFYDVTNQLDLWKRKYERERSKRLTLEKRLKQYEQQFEPRRQMNSSIPPRHLSTSSSMSTTTEQTMQTIQSMSLANTTLTSHSGSDVPTEVSDSIHDVVSVLRQLKDSCSQLRNSHKEVHSMIEEYQWSLSIMSDFSDKCRRMHGQLKNFLSETSASSSIETEVGLGLLNSINDTLQEIITDKHLANLLAQQDRVNDFVLDSKNLRKVFVLSNDALSLVESMNVKVPPDHMSTTSSSSHSYSTILVSPKTVSCDESARSRSASPNLIPASARHAPRHHSGSPPPIYLNNQLNSLEPATARRQHRGSPQTLPRSQSHSPMKLRRPGKSVKERRR